MDKLKNFENLVKICLKNAYDMYGIEEQNVKITFNLRGRSAGQAGYNHIFGQGREYFLEFNKKAILENYEEMVQQTIPHEVAHLIAWMKPSLGAEKHNYAWQKIDRSLGGTGERYHSMQNISSVRRQRHIYLVDGRTFKLTTMKHNKIQKRQRVYFTDPTFSRQILPCDYKETIYI